MKRLIVLLSIVMIFTTGCSVVKLDNNNLSSNIKNLLSEKVNLHNVYFEGYKYYVPKGLKFIDKEEYNALLSDKDGVKYYLYVDAISYYHRVDNNYKVNEKSHFSKKLDYGKKTGFIQIDKTGKDEYFIQFVYNYSKMEAYATSKNLTRVVNNMCYVLRTVKFNDKILESLIGENVLSYKEENYSLFETDSSSNKNFLDVVEQYEDDAYKKDIEDETIDLGDE